MIVYLLDNNVNAIKRAYQNAKGHVFYENKDILHKTNTHPIMRRVKSQFFKNM